jgi:hypothetical protein
MPARARHIVKVWGQECEVIVHRLSRTACRAVGMHMGRWLEVRELTESAALRTWTDAAKNRGDDKSQATETA